MTVVTKGFHGLPQSSRKIPRLVLQLHHSRFHPNPLEFIALLSSYVIRRRRVSRNKALQPNSSNLLREF
jgi:hypothetical protein